MLRQDIAGRPCSVHAHAEMAIADYPVQLPVRQIDEPFGFAACVVFQPGGTEQGGTEGDRNRRVVAAYDGRKRTWIRFRATWRGAAPDCARGVQSNVNHTFRATEFDGVFSGDLGKRLSSSIEKSFANRSPKSDPFETRSPITNSVMPPPSPHRTRKRVHRDKKSRLR